MTLAWFMTENDEASTCRRLSTLPNVLLQGRHLVDLAMLRLVVLTPVL